MADSTNPVDAQDVGGNQVDNRSEYLNMRLDAYYYSFEATGVIEIDRILSAVATAGKHYHHTEDWGEKEEQAIQDAANAAAKALTQGNDLPTEGYTPPQSHLKAQTKAHTRKED